jgi:hypothetical protein
MSFRRFSLNLSTTLSKVICSQPGAKQPLSSNPVRVRTKRSDCRLRLAAVFSRTQAVFSSSDSLYAREEPGCLPNPLESRPDMRAARSTCVRGSRRSTMTVTSTDVSIDVDTYSRFSVPTSPPCPLQASLLPGRSGPELLHRRLGFFQQSSRGSFLRLLALTRFRSLHQQQFQR